MKAIKFGFSIPDTSRETLEQLVDMETRVVNDFLASRHQPSLSSIERATVRLYLMAKIASHSQESAGENPPPG